MNSKSKIKLFNKNFFLLWQGQFVSKLGSQVFFVAMVLWIKDLTQSASLLGLLGFISGIPAIIFSVVGGTYADRHSRKKIIVWSDFLSGIITILLAILMFYFPSEKMLLLSFVFFVAIASSIIQSFFNPAISAAIPDIIPSEKLTSGNGWVQSTQQFSSIVGWAIGGALYVILGAPLLVLINAITFIFSAVSEIFISIPQKIPEAKKLWKDKLETFKLDLISGFKYIWQKAGLKKLVLASVFLNFFAAPIFLLLPFYISNNLKLNDDWFGYLVAISSVGSVVGYLFAGIVKFSGKNRALTLLIFMFLSGVVYILLGSFLTLVPAIVIFFLSGFFSGYIQVQIFTILQITTDANKRGRVFGFLGTISAALAPIGMGLGGVIADFTNKGIPNIYIGCGIIITLLIIVIFPDKDVRKFLSHTDNEIESEDSSGEKFREQNSDIKIPKGDFVLNKVAMEDLEKLLKRKIDQNNFK